MEKEVMEFVQAAPIPTQEELLAVSVAYSNSQLIADDVLPRVPVGRRAFKYLSFPKGMKFDVVDDTIGRKGDSNQVDFKGTENTGAVEGHGLHDFVPVEDMMDAPENHNPIMMTVENLTDLVSLNRERRVANKVFAAANYATGNKTTLTGTGQFSHADSSPIDTIGDAIDACLMRPNKMVVGRPAFSVLSRHADILTAINRSAGDKGIATKQAIAELFELEEVIVGEASYNTAKKGQTVSMSKAWTDSLALIHQNKMANTQHGVTFGYTAEFGTWTIVVKFDETKGVKGAWFVKVSESVQEVIMADDLGYLFTDCVA